MRDIRTSRRAVMCALAVTPLSAIPAVKAATTNELNGLVCLPADRGAWNAAVMAEHQARAAMNKFDADFIRPASAAHDAGTGPIERVHELEEAWTPYTSAHADAVDALILTPAPNWEAVEKKLELGISDHAFDGSSKSERMVGAILADVRRLAGRAS